MLNNVRRATLFAGLIVALCNLAAAQYGGGMGMGVGMPGSPTYNPNRSYGSKTAIIGGVAEWRVAPPSSVGGTTTKTKQNSRAA
jgi:hypothetical protein